jgi:hypothetical protein
MLPPPLVGVATKLVGGPGGNCAMALEMANNMAISIRQQLAAFRLILSFK